MSAAFLFWSGLISLAALLPIVLPLLRAQNEDEAGREARRQRDALAAARAAGVLTQDEYDAKLAALPRPAAARTRPERVLAALLFVLVPLTALLLYRQVGDVRALDPEQLVAAESVVANAPDLASAVAGLEQRLAGQPDDAEGLRLLARGYQSLQRFADARDTLAKVRALLPDDLDVQVEFAEALALASDSRRIEGEAEALLADALGKNPNHERALWLSGIAAVQRDDKPAALALWQRLLPLLPPDSEVHAAVEEQIRGIGGEPAAAADGEAATTAATDVAADTSAPAAAIRVQVRVAEALRARVAPTDIVYVFARAAEGPKMPLAIQRFAAAELPKEVLLDDSMGMMPTLKLSQQQRIVVGARISKSGDAIPKPGDFEVLSAPLDQAAGIPAPLELEIANVLP
jgi:cytochrome c-type biogenesis protein CcmH